MQRAQLELARASRNGTTVGLLFVDLDDVDGRLGHEVGDRVHAVIAARLRACLRAIDVTT